MMTDMKQIEHRIGYTATVYRNGFGITPQKI